MKHQTITEKKNLQKEHFIPISVKDLIFHLSSDLDLSKNENVLFKQFCKIYISLYHAKFFEELQSLKEKYLPFSPDQSNRITQNYTAEELNGLQKKLLEEISFILEKANYTAISKEELNSALSETSPYGLDVSVNFEDFDEIHLFYRGLTKKSEPRRSWKTLFLSTENVDVTIYRRLFLIVKLNSNISRAKSESLIRNPKKYLLQKWQSLFQLDMTRGGDGSYIYLKLFKDIPKSDLEMLFPNTHIDIKRIDKITMGVSGGGGIIGGIIAVISKLVRAVNMTTIFFAIAGFLSIVWREIGKIFSNRNRYMAMLAKSLYFHNLDNNLGVLSNLIEMAEEEEFKEALLAYWFLLKSGQEGCSKIELDLGVEHYLKQNYDLSVNFELDDGLRKLQESKLLQPSESNVLKVYPLETAIERLNREWDDMY